jgi:hypothetical protein
MDRVPLIYLYLDDQGITSLHSQTTERLEVDIRESREATTVAKLKARLGILLGTAGVGADAESGVSRKRIEEKALRLTAEQRLRLLVDYFDIADTVPLYRDMATAKKSAHMSNTPVFVYVRDRFDVPQFYGGIGGVEDANNSGYVLFQAGDASLSDRIVMSASLAKFTRVRAGKMSRMGHDTILFTEFKGRALPIGVFGAMTCLNENGYHLKPYGIWI